MEQNSQEGSKKGLDFVRATGMMFYILNLYWYCQSFVSLALPASFCGHTYRFLQMVDDKLHLFLLPYVTLLMALFFIGLYGWAERGRKEERMQTNLFLSPVCWLLEHLGIVDRGVEGRVVEENDNGKRVEKIRLVRTEGWCIVLLGLFIVTISPIALKIRQPVVMTIFYVLLSGVGILYFVFGCNYIHKVGRNFGVTDSESEESFKQNEHLIENAYSVNLPTCYKYKGEVRNGWINVVNPFRATSVLGTPGSGKTYAVINEFIRQHLRKNFTMYCYDFKFPDLSVLVYNHLLRNEKQFKAKYGISPQFCVINFDDPRRSLRCNPIHPDFMNDITDAYDSAYTIMLNLNKSWAQKQGDFFVESPINYLTASIWYLKETEGGRYCTLPHVIEWINAKYSDCIPLMSMNPSLTNYMSAFMEAWEGGAQDQLQGQIASVRIPLSRISSPQLYWVMTGNDFSLDLNDPEAPKILCVGNNPEKKDIYATALGLYNGRIVKVINKKNRHPISLIIDELPTIYFRGLDNLIATARSNKVSVCLGYQDFTQLIRDYGEKEAKAIINTIGNLFSGQVTGDTASQLEKRFGKNMQKRKSQSFSASGVSTSVSEQNDTMIPASRISTLTQGTFIGAVADNVGEEISEKIFNAKIVIDHDAVKEEESSFLPMPLFYDFDTSEEVVELKRFTISFLKQYHVVACGCEAELRSLVEVDHQDVSAFMERFLPFVSRVSERGQEMARLSQVLLDQLREVDCRGMECFDSWRKSVIEYIEYEPVTQWIKQEKAFSQNRYAGASLGLGDALREMMEEIDRRESSESRDCANVRNMVEAILRYFTELGNFSQRVNEIRESTMQNTLKRQMEQVRQDIKGLLERQINILDTDPQWQTLSRRRKEAMGMD